MDGWMDDFVIEMNKIKICPTVEIACAAPRCPKGRFFEGFRASSASLSNKGNIKMKKIMKD